MTRTRWGATFLSVLLGLVAIADVRAQVAGPAGAGPAGPSAADAPPADAPPADAPPTAAGLTRERLQSSLYGAGFAPALDDDIVEQLLELDAAWNAGEWVRAFRYWDEHQQQLSGRLVPWSGELSISAEEYVRRRLAAAPPAARQAFRLFYEARARQEAQGWESLDDSESAARAEEIFRRYFATSVGDNAADRLGDAHFERGEFRQAAACWTAILDDHPDSELSELRLRMKRAAALRRAGDRAAVERELASIRARFAGQPVVLGGRTRPAEAWLADWLADISVGSRDDSPPPAVPLPGSNATRWIVGGPFAASVYGRSGEAQVAEVGDLLVINHGQELIAYRLADGGRVWPPQQSEGLLGQVANLLPGPLRAIFGGAPAIPIETPPGVAPLPRTDPAEEATPSVEPPATPDAELGVPAAVPSPAGADPFGAPLEAEANAEFADFADPQAEMPPQPAAEVFQPIATDQGMVIAVVQRDGALVVAAFDRGDGRIRWSTQGAKPLHGHWPCSSPLVADGRVFFATFRGGTTELWAHALAIADGGLVWSSRVGSSRPGNEQQQQTGRAAPALGTWRDELHLLTNDGALVGVDAARGDVRWLCRVAAPPMRVQQYYYNEVQPTQRPGRLLYDGSLAIFKEQGGWGLHAFDLEQRRLAWSRPMLPDAALCAADGEGYYLLRDHELEMYSKQDRHLVWSVALPTTGLDVLAGAEAIVVPTIRGLFEVERTTGDVRQIVRDDELARGPGGLLVASDTILSLRSNAVRCYGVPAGAAP